MMNLLYKKRRLLGNKGFSLVELIIVIAIMAVLMAVLAPQLLKYVEKSRIQADETAASEILNAVKIAIADDEIYSKLDSDGEETVTWQAAVTGTADIVGDNPSSGLADEVKKVITDIPHAKSQKYKNSNYVVTVTIDPANLTADAKGAWNAVGGSGT